MSRIPRVLLACGAAALALATTTVAASAAAPVTTTNPATAAAGWVAQQFSATGHARVPNGTHIELSYDLGQGPVYYYDGGTTIDAITALAATHTGGAKIRAATSYVAAHLNDYVDYTGTQGGPFYGSVGKAAFLAEMTGNDPNNFGGHHLLTELKSNECATGSTSCTPGSNSGVYSSVATSYIVIAEARAGGAFAPSANLVDFFLAEQCADGGFSSAVPAGSGSSCAPDVDATGYAVMALQALGGHASQISHAADWLVSQRTANGSWTSQGGPNIDSTGFAAAALRIAGRNAASSTAWLRSQQVTDGPTLGTGSQRGAFKYEGAYDASASIKGTCDALWGLIPGSSLATVTANRASSGTAVLALAAPSLAHGTVPAGHTQTVTGTGFSAGEKVRATLYSAATVVGTASASSSGTVRLTFTVPAAEAAGTHTVRLAGLASQLTAATTFRVTRAASTTPTTPSSSAPVLADTGRDGRTTRAEVALGTGLLATGSLALLAGRRRPRGRRAR